MLHAMYNMQEELGDLDEQKCLMTKHLLRIAIPMREMMCNL